MLTLLPYDVRLRENANVIRCKNVGKDLCPNTEEVEEKVISRNGKVVDFILNFTDYITTDYVFRVTTVSAPNDVNLVVKSDRKTSSKKLSSTGLNQQPPVTGLINFALLIIIVVVKTAHLAVLNFRLRDLRAFVLLRTKTPVQNTRSITCTSTGPVLPLQPHLLPKMCLSTLASTHRRDVHNANWRMHEHSLLAARGHYRQREIL